MTAVMAMGVVLVLSVAVVGRQPVVALYAVYLVGVAVRHNPYVLRRQAALARRAVEANRG